MLPHAHSTVRPFSNLATRHDAANHTLWFGMDAPRPCFSEGLISDILAFQDGLAQTVADQHVRCLAFTSQADGVFSLGGDLALFRQCAEQHNRERLQRYADRCVSVLYNHLTAPTVTLSVVRGDMLGAGLESALSSDVIIAERGYQAGFPEVLFDMVPGHGAYHLVARRLGTLAAQEMILSGQVFTTDELHRRGLIDILVDPGFGITAAEEFMAQHQRRWNAYSTLQLIKRTHHPITHEALLESARCWVDAVMRLTHRNLRMMDRLVAAQERRQPTPPAAVATQVPPPKTSIPIPVLSLSPA